MAAPTESPPTERARAGEPSSIRGEIRALTGLRILAALWVVVFHFSFTPGSAYTALWQPLQPLVHTGALGVDLFYVLSGFVITLTYLEKLGPRPSARAALAFYWARICRIWPVYALLTTLFGGWILYKAHRTPGGLHAFMVWQTTQPEVSVWSYLKQLLMVQLWSRPTFDGSSWVAPAWSISAEWLAYLCFPVVVLVIWRVRRLPAAVTGVLAVACMVPFAYVSYRGGNPYFPHSWLLRIGGGFLAGALTCLFVQRIRRTPRAENVAALVAVVALADVLLGIWWGWWRGGGQNEYGAAVVVLFPVLVGSLALSRRGLSRWLSTPAMVHGGRISFSLYLVHVPVFEIFWTEMGWHGRIGPDTPLGEVLVPHVLVGVVVLAHLTYRYVEEPARLFLRDRGPGRLAAPRQRPAAAGPTAVTAPAAPGLRARQLDTDRLVPVDG